MSDVTIRPLDPETDIGWFHELNETCVPEVNSVPPAELARMIGAAAHARAAVLADGTPAGVMLAFAPEADYGSLNFLWFRDRYDDFWYVDRVMVSADARGLGIGGRLYADLFACAAGKTAAITCEVNSRPPNPRSLAFHERLGFGPVGEQETEGGKKSVVLLRRPL